MWSKTLIGRALSMRSTPLGPWEVGCSAGPAGAGLQGRYCSVADVYPPEGDTGRKSKRVKTGVPGSTTDPNANRDTRALSCFSCRTR